MSHLIQMSALRLRKSGSMADDRWQRVRDLIDAARERPAETRKAFLRAACSDEDAFAAS